MAGIESNIAEHILDETQVETTTMDGNMEKTLEIVEINQGEASAASDEAAAFDKIVEVTLQLDDDIAKSENNESVVPPKLPSKIPKKKSGKKKTTEAPSAVENEAKEITDGPSFSLGDLPDSIEFEFDCTNPGVLTTSNPENEPYLQSISKMFGKMFKNVQNRQF